MFTYVISRFYIDPETNKGTTDMRYVIVPGVGASDTTMPNYSSAKDGQPWAEAAVSTFYIAKGVTGIGSYAFASQPSLNNVVFQDASDLTYIGQRAFYDDDNAVFTDEGSEDENATLDLSGVTTMGEYAFYNCDKLTGVELGGSITAVEGNGNTSNKIPNHAFTSTGVQSITVPSEIKEVGEYAFYDCPLNIDPYISLQEGLKTIGDYAFGKNDAAPNTMMTSLTIPSSVQSIGDHAFYNYKGLQTVTVLGKDNGGAKESVLDHVGDAAFGDADHNAYSTTTTIQDAVHPEIEYTGLVGTQFYLPKELEKNDNLFVNGETCYTGDITPMQYVNTEPADCINPGYDIYKTTFTGAASSGEPIVMTYHYPIPALGHDYGPITEVKRTCENDNYFVQHCLRKNCPNKGDAVGSLWKSGIGMGLFDPDTDQKLTEEELESWREKFKDHEGHKWEAKSVVNPTIEAGKTTTLYYSCTNPDHSKTDRYTNPFLINLTGKTINALTTQSPSDIASQLVGFTTYGKVELVSSSDEPFGTEGIKYLEVKYTMTQDKNQNWPVFTKALEGTPDSASGTATLKIKVNVTKDVLDLSNVSILPNMVNVGTPAAVKAAGFGAATPGEVEYFADGEWTTTQPDKEGKGYKVRVKFTYNAAMYDLPEEGDLEYPDDGYTLKREGDSVWVEHSFVVALHQITAQARAISGLTYDETAHDTLEVIGLEDGWHVSVTAIKQGASEPAATWEHTGEETEENIISGLSLTDAGTYNVQVVFTYPGHSEYEQRTQNLEVHIDHKQVAKPVALQNMKYEPVSEERSGFTQETSDVWKFVDEGEYTHVGINAGKYTAKATLTNENYRWENTDEAVRDITIPWEILKRELYAPSINQPVYGYKYDKWVNPLVNPNSDYSFEPDKGTKTVKLVYIGNKDTDDYDQEAAVAYTAANAYHTNRGKYLVTVTLNARGNYVWFGNAPSGLEWTINPATLTLPTIEAEDADYTGKPYDAGSLVTVKNDGVTLPDDVKSAGYQYSNDTTFRSPSNNAPINAGTYFVRQNYTYNNQNYIAQIPYASFTINKATATMEFGQKEVTKTYTAEGTALQPVTVTGLVEADKDNMATVLGDVKYTYKYSTEPNTNWDTVEEVKDATTKTKFTDVGYYQITAKWGAGTVSNNYTATDATYTLTITQAEDQSITLTPDNKDRWTEAKDQTPANYTITYGQAATFKVIGTAALDKDHATISYTVKEGSDVVSVDSGSGVVTIKQAGTATITVTAAETPNVGADSVDYTVTVEKATPALELDAGTAAYTGSAVAADVYQKATLSGAGDGYAQPDKEKLEYYFYTYGEDGQDTILADTDHSEALATPSSVGTYWLKVVFPGDACYSDAAAVAKFTITPAELSVSATGHTGTYDGSEHKAITIKSVTGNDTQLAEGNYTVKYATTETNTPPKASDGVWQDALSVKDVADSSSDTLYYWYMVTADNYNPAIGKVEVKITPAPLTVAGEPTHYTKEYDGDKTVDETFDEITVTAEDVPDVTISVAATGTYDNENAGKGKDVTLTLTLSGTEIKWDNYSYNGAAPTDGKITLTQADAGTITPKEITVTGISAVDRVYDGTTDVELKGTPETTDKVGSDDLTLTLTSNATGSIESADVGNDKAVTVATSVITLGGTDANNYKVSAVKDAANGDVKVNITQRPVNLEFAGIGQDGRIIEKAYTGQPVNVTVGPVASPAEGTGFIDSDQLKAGDVDYTYMPVDPTTDTDHTAVGSYTVTAALKADPTGNYDNYELKFPDAATLKITPAEMVVDAQSYTGTYTGKAHNVTDSWTAETTDSASTEIEITKVEFIKKTDDTRPEAGAEGWDEIPFINVAQSGEYWYKVTAENYAPIVGDSAVTITINPATLTLSSDLTEEKEYDGTTEAEVTGETVTGAQNGESITVSSVSAAYDNANVGTGKTITTTYEVTFGAGVTPGNYTYTGNVEGKATSTWTIKTTVEDGKITQAPVTVTISDQTSVYDGEKPTVGQEEGTKEDPKAWYVSTGEVFSQDTTKDNLGITLSIAPDSKDADTYAITGEWTNSNYDVIFTGSWTGEDENKDHAGTYTIEPRPINVQIGDTEGFYGDVPDLTLKTKVILAPETAQGEEAGLVNGENIYGALKGLSLGSNATVSSYVGENYIIYPLNNGEVDQDKTGVYGNYDVTFTNNGTYTVKPRPITITIEDQESDYGCEIAKLAYSETLSNTYTGTNENVVFVGDDETDLKIALSTTAKKGSDAGTYPISGEAKAESSVVSNYAITWKGETPYQENEEQATYTVKKATLAVEFTNEEVTVSMGGTVNNPLKFINQSNSDEELGGQPQDVTVKYSSNDQGVATVNETTGEITLVGTGNATITAEVTSGGKNFTEGAKDSYIIHVAEDGGLLVTVTPKTLTYTGEMQNLISYSTAPAGAEVTFKVEAQTEGDRCQIASDDGLPQGQDAGTYRVSWVAKLQGYRDATGSTTVTIAKASPTTGFSKETVSVPYEENGTFDSTEETTLNVADDYKGTITYMSNDTRVASVQGNSLENISLNGTGSATITAVFTETDNYTAATASFRITVGTAETTISYTAEDYSVEYDRIAHGSKITVNSPSEYTIMYSDNNGTSYDLNESPTITDAGDLTIYFQIQADGYNSASGTQKVTVEPKEITANMVTGIAESYTYTGKEITFDDAISVHDEGVLLEKDKDYTITYDDNKEVGQGSVTITGRGNYKGSVTKNFTISPVDASDLTASLNRTFGYYGDSYTNNATVKVMHGNLHEVDSSEIELTVTRKDDTSASSDVTTDDLKLTFNKAGIYTIHVEVSGTHTGTFDLTYTLLPQDVASDDFQVATDPVDRVWTYDGENHAFGVTVTSGGTSLQKDVDFTLHYTYLPYVGNPTDDVYDPGTTAFTEAGIYTVIVEGTGNYTGHAELVALIQPRDLSDAGIAAAIAQTGLVYNGEAQEPDVTLTYNGAEISQLKDTEYYGNTNAGEAQALSAASEDCNNFTGARVDAFTIEKKSLKDSTITAKADPEEYYYTGYPVTPAVTVTDSGRNVDLSIGADYTVTSDAVGPGKVTATVTGTGNYKDTVTVEFTILPTGAEPVETLNLTVTPSEWTWDNGQTKAAISVTFNGKELNDTDYQLTVSKDGETPQTVTKAEAVELLSAPGEYTITATGTNAYKDSKDTETVTVKKIQPELTVTAAPETLSGGGKVTLTLKGEKLPAFAEGQDLSSLLTASAKDEKNAPDLSELEWETDEQTGVMTAELTLPNTSETYTFTLTFTGNEYYEAATASEQVVVAQQIISGGGGGPVEDQPADPDDTGVSDWLNTKDHLAYLAGYPGGTFGPDQNMTRAEAAQMFYNLLLEKDVEITVEFEDVPADAWYAKPVNTLASLGILSGVGNGRFDPERSITRAEFTVIAMKFANTSGGGVNIFSDVNEDDWFYSAVVDSTQYGWINGYPDGTFRPGATITRAEVTVIVNHMLGRAADRPYVIAHEKELNTFGDVNRGHWGYFHIAEATNAHEYHTEDGTESWTGLS